VARAIGIFEATRRVVLTTIAVEQYRRQHRNLPPALADLDGPAWMRQDPFSGDVLRYRADDSRFIIYSVGADGRDDGGRLEVAAGKGSAPGVGPLLDVGVRVTTRPS
jgi:putative SOS response-associated peptidase YedK